MPTPTSKGVYVKPRRAWNLDSAAGVAVTQAIVAGQFNYGQLYNDSQPAADLAVWAWTLFQGNPNSFILVKQFQGILPGATLWSRGNPLIAGGATPPGSFYLLTSATTFGTTLIDVNGPNSIAIELRESPIFIIPPGWSLLFVPSSNGTFASWSVTWSKW